MRKTLTLVAILAAACTRAPVAQPPAAEFLLVAGDSTYWVSSGPAGVRVRASGITLASYGGRFHEVFIADDDHSYEDALLVGQGVYSRDLISGDSTLVFADTLVGRLAREYAAAHPNEIPLPPDDPGPDRPATAATSDVSFIDIHGPFLSLEYRARTRKRGGPSVHTSWRAVVDLRRLGQRSLEDLVGGQAATRAVAEGRRSLAHAVDSARSAAGRISPVAVEALRDVRFDDRSFSIADTNGAPAVEFAARVAGGAAGGALLSLPRLAVPTPAWWAEVRNTLPLVVTDDGVRWKRARYELLATSDSSGDQARIALIDSTHRSWPVRKVPTPVQHVFWLDSPRADSATRASLRRAFDEAALYDGVGSVARAAAPRDGARFLPASEARRHAKPGAGKTTLPKRHSSS